MNVGGTSRYICELIEKIPNSQLATGYVQSLEIEDLSLQKFEVIRIPHLGRKVSPINDFRAWLELRKIIIETKPKIVHTHTFKAGLIGRLVGGDHKRVHTFHGHLFDDRSFSPIQKFLITKIEMFLAQRTNLLISVGKKVGDQLRARGIGDLQNWESISPGVQPHETLGKVRARESLGLMADGILFGWMARMAEVKNPFLLLQIAGMLPEVNFVMAGGGQLLETVKKQAPKNVSVIGWVDAAIFWSAVDCAISTSDNEGMPIALIEAQLAGLPVIATDVGSIAEVIENGITGIVTSRSAEELSHAIRKIALNPSIRTNMGEMARLRALKEFSLDKLIYLHEDAYYRLCNDNFR